ncbi:MAG: hypothetical protein M3Z37_01665 [Candidatus Eremiobacteraeota bacterium]|nr:hypothetical protein [Candidatus Eremiobacteraeota bacterium]
MMHSAGHQRVELGRLSQLHVAGLLISLDMQVHDPMATLRQARLEVPDLPMCALVAVDRLERAREAISAGCRGAVSTAASLDVLIAALEAISGGEAYVDSTLGGRLLAKSIMRPADGRSPKHLNASSFVAKAGDVPKN